MKRFKFFRGFKNDEQFPPLREWGRIRTGNYQNGRLRERIILPLSFFGGRLSGSNSQE